MIGEFVSAIGNAITLQSIAGPIIGGLLGWAGAHYTAERHARLAHEEREERAKTAKAKVEAAQVDSQARREATQADNLTARFKTLMDGYESRITDLTTEVQTLRQAVAKIQQTLDDHRQLCASCPYRASHAATRS